MAPLPSEEWVKGGTGVDWGKRDSGNWELEEGVGDGGASPVMNKRLSCVDAAGAAKSRRGGNWWEGAGTPQGKREEADERDSGLVGERWTARGQTMLVDQCAKDKHKKKNENTQHVISSGERNWGKPSPKPVGNPKNVPKTTLMEIRRSTSPKKGGRVLASKFGKGRQRPPPPLPPLSPPPSPLPALAGLGGSPTRTMPDMSRKGGAREVRASTGSPFHEGESRPARGEPDERKLV